MKNQSRIVAALAVLSLPLLAQGSLRPAGGPAPLGPKPLWTVIAENQDGRNLEVKFVADSGVRLRQGHLVGLPPEVEEIDRWLDSIGARKERVFQQSEERLEELLLSGEARSGRPLHDLNLFFRIECVGACDAGEVCDFLNARAVVEIAYPLGEVGDPLVRIAPAPAVTIGATPDFEPLQGYRRAAPLGIDADYGNTFSGGLGTGTTIADVETGWTDDHEDIAHKAFGNHVGLEPVFYPWDHGTAVLGELVGEDNGQGVRGIAPDAEVRMSTHQGSAVNIPTAVVNAIDAVGPGDFVVLEVQCFGGAPDPYPCEFVDSIFAAVEIATANGIHVVAAAGNGDRNLDDPAFMGKFDRDVRDSGAIIVGASDGSSLNKAFFSNYGSRLDAHGWGFDVTTAAYGDLFSEGFPPELREYTAFFSGTSSATPIVTGAAILLNGIRRSAFGSGLDPSTLRATLTATGTPQGLGGNIGPRPDLRAAIEELGIPRVELKGALTPGSPYQVHLAGPSRGYYALFFSASLREEPLSVPPFGYLLLGDPVRSVSVGKLGPQGSVTHPGMIPADALPGTTIGYYQALVRHADARHGGYTNYDALTVQ